MFAIAGCHRSGKTTLAEKLADANGWEFVRTNVSQVFVDLGKDVKAEMPFAERLDVQDAILKSLEVQYSLRAGKIFVADRSPFDVIGYTLTELNRSTLDDEALAERMVAHVSYARRIVFEHLMAVMKVTPLYGTPTAAGKAQTNPFYMTLVDAAIERAVMDITPTLPGFTSAVSGAETLEDRMADANNFFGRFAEALKPKEPKIWMPD